MTCHSDEEPRERDELDDLIDRCDMIQTTGKSREELHRMVEKATMCLNMAHCLSDVIETLVMDAECILRPFGATFEREDKLHFKQLSKALQDAKKCANMVRLLADRTGDDELKTLQVINWITTMPSQLHMFDVKKRDFKKIKL